MVFMFTFRLIFFGLLASVISISVFAGRDPDSSSGSEDAPVSSSFDGLNYHTKPAETGDFSIGDIVYDRRSIPFKIENISEDGRIASVIGWEHNEGWIGSRGAMFLYQD